MCTMKESGMSQIFLFVLEVTILSAVHGSVVTKYQSGWMVACLVLVMSTIYFFLFHTTHGGPLTSYPYVPPPPCPTNAVCSEIYAAPSSSSSAPTFYNFVQCRCDSGLYCPDKPGPQTISASSNKWYGMCQPVEELDRCDRGQVAEKIIIGSVDFEGKNYIKVDCTCPQHENEYLSEGSASTVWYDTITDDPTAKTIYEFLCMEDKTSKRGRSRGRKFYFYRR